MFTSAPRYPPRSCAESTPGLTQPGTAWPGLFRERGNAFGLGDPKGNLPSCCRQSGTGISSTPTEDFGAWAPRVRHTK